MDVIDRGIITRKSDQKKYNYYIIQLDERHLSQVIELNDYVIKNLEKKDICVSLSTEEWKNVLGNNGIVLGVFVNQRLVGVRTTLFPYDSEENLGSYIGLPQEEMSKVVHLDTTNIHSDFRGNSLQKRMIDVTLKMLRKSKNFKHLFTTVSPFNIPSIKSILFFNIPIIGLELKYGGLLRYVFYQNLLNPLEIDKEKAVAILNTDIKLQKELLQAGYCAFKCSQSYDGKLHVLYGKMKKEYYLVNREEAIYEKIF